MWGCVSSENSRVNADPNEPPRPLLVPSTEHTVQRVFVLLRPDRLVGEERVFNKVSSDL